MFKNFFKISKKLFAMKFSFSLPKKKNILLYSKKPPYNELKRVLDNIKNCSQTNWEKKYFSVVKKQL